MAADLKKKATAESTFLAAAPIRDAQVSARVELTPPISNGAEVQEKVTKVNIVDTEESPVGRQGH